MRRDKRYATRSVQPAQPGPSAKVSCTPPQEARSVPVQPERWNRSPLFNSSQHGMIDESPRTDQSNDSFKPARSKARRDTSGNNVDRPRQSVRLRKFDNGKVQENGDSKDIMLITQHQSYLGCEGDGLGEWKQLVDLQPGSTLIKTENPEDITHTVSDNHVCHKKALLSAARSDYLKRSVPSSRQIKVNKEVWQDHLCQGGCNGYVGNSADTQVLGRMSSGMAGTLSANADTMCSNYSARNVRCQEKETFSQTGSADRSSVCKKTRPLSHVNQSESKPREKKVGLVKMEKVACLPSSMSHDTSSGLQDEQAENCIVIKTEIPSEQHLVCERNPSRQSPVPLRNHSSSYKFHSLRTDRCSPGPNSCDLSSSWKSDPGKQGLCCKQKKSLKNNLTPDENYRELVTCNECPDNYTLENRKSRTFQKISRKAVSLNSVYKENTVAKSSLTEEMYRSPPPPPLPANTITTTPSITTTHPLPPSSLPSRNNKLFSSEASRFSPETSCVKSSLQYEQNSVINPPYLVSPPRTIQGRHYWPLGSIPLKEEEKAGSQYLDLNEVQSPPVFKNVSEALHRLPESPKVPLVCMKDVIVIDSSPASETSTCSYQSNSPEQDLTAKSPQNSRRAYTSSKSKVAQRLSFVHEKESTSLQSQTKNLNYNNPASPVKKLGSDSKKDNSNKTVSAKATSNSMTSRGTEKAFAVNNSDLILPRTDRIRSPSIRYKDDVLFFPLVFPSRSSQSATNRVSEVVEKVSNNRQPHTGLEQKGSKKKENLKVIGNAKPVEKVNSKSKRNTECASSAAAAASKLTESLDRKRILRGSSSKSENVFTTKDATPSESLPVSFLPIKKEQICFSDSKMLTSGGQSSLPSSDSALLPLKSNKVLRSQSSSLQALLSTPPLLPPLLPSSPPSSSASSSQSLNPEPKCSSGGRTSPSDQANSTTKEPKTKMKQNDTDTDIISRPKLNSSTAKATIADVTCKSSNKGDEPLVKKPVQKTISKLQSSLRSHSSTSTVIREPSPLSILSRPERESIENRKLNAFVSDELDKYLAQEISNYALSPQKISKSTSDRPLGSKKTDREESKKILSKIPLLSPKKIFCDKNVVSGEEEQQSDSNSSKKMVTTTTTVAYNTRRRSSLNKRISPEKNDNQATNSSVSLYTTPLIPKVEPDAASSKRCEKPEYKSEPMPTPTSASSDCQNMRKPRPRSEQLTARLNKPGSSYSNSSLLMNNSQPYEPDFDEVDGILFMSFPNVESLQAHIAVERKSNWESAPSHMSSISKVLNFNRWKERHKAMKLPRPALEKSKTLRGLHMRMKMYYKLLRSEWHKIKQRNQYRSRYGFKKTNDFSKIKSWQARLSKNQESKKSSQKLNWRTQDVLVCNLKPDEIRQIRIVKRRKKHFILTHRKGGRRANVSRNEKLENSSKSSEVLDPSVNDRKKETGPSSHTVTNSIKGPVSGTNSNNECLNVLKSAHLLYQSDEINIIKKLGGCDPGDHAMRKRTRSQVELENFHRRRKNLPPIALDWLTHNMAQVAMTALHEDYVKKKVTTAAGKTVSCVNSEGKHNTDTFIQVDSQPVARVQSSEETLPSIFEHQKSPLPSSSAPGSAVQLCKTSDEELAKDTARILLDRQKLKAKDDKCNKPGCRYGCICHLCWISENFEDSSKTSAICTKTCDKEYCRLGCICDSNDNIQLESMCDGQTCTLECCQCTEHKSVTPVPGTKKESLKLQTPHTLSDVASVSQEKLTNDKEPEFSQEGIKSKAADVVDSLPPRKNEPDTDKGSNKRSDSCVEKLKPQRRDNRQTTSSLLHKRESAHRDLKNLDDASRKPLNTEDSEIFQTKKKRKLNSVEFDGKSPKVNFPKVSQLQTKSSSAYTEDEKDNSKTGQPPNSIKRLCPLRDDCRQPLEQCYVNCSWFPANTFDNCVVEIDRLGSPEQMRELGCMSVDCFPQSPKVRSPQQMGNSRSTVPSANNTNNHTDCIKCELIDLSPIKVKPSAEASSPPVIKMTDTSLQTKADSIRLLGEVADSEKWTCPLVDLTDMSAEEDPAESRVDKDWQVTMVCLTTQKNMEDGYQLVKFISNCNWDSHSSDVISQVSLCCQPGKYPNPQKMAVGNFDVEILPKSDKAPNAPPQFLCFPYKIRVKVTDRTKGSVCGETVESLDSCSYVGISSIRPIRNNDHLDIKNMPLTATLQDINYPSQEDNEPSEITNEAKNVVGEIEVLEIHPPLDNAKMPPRDLVLDLSSPGNQKPLQPDPVKLVTDLSQACDVPVGKLLKPGMLPPTNSGEGNCFKPFSENLAPPLTAAVDLSFTTSEETKTTADALLDVRGVSRQCSSKEKAALVHDWSFRSKLGKAIKQELPVEDIIPLKKCPTKFEKNCDSQNEKTKSRNRDSPQQLPNDSTDYKTDLCLNCSSAQNLKLFEDEFGKLKSPIEKTPLMQSFRKILPAPSLNGGFFVTSSQPGVGSFCLGHLQGCSLLRTDHTNFTHNHAACSAYSNAYRLGSVPTNQLLQLVPVAVPVPVPVPVTFSMAPDGSAVNTNVTIPIIYSNNGTTTCSVIPGSSSISSCSPPLKTDTTGCSSCGSILPPNCPNRNSSCIAVTSNIGDCDTKSGNNVAANGLPPQSLPPTVSQPSQNVISPGWNNSISDPCNTFMKNDIDGCQGHCTNKCLMQSSSSSSSSSQKCDVNLNEVKVVPDTNNELVNYQETSKSLQSSVAASSKNSLPFWNHQDLVGDCMCDVHFKNSIQEKVEKKLCAKKSQMNETPATTTTDVEPVNCFSSFQSGLHFDCRPDTSDEDEEFDIDDWSRNNNFDQSGRDRRSKHQLTVHKTRERERRCTIFNGINFLQKVLFKDEHIQILPQKKILDFATDHIKSLHIFEEELSTEKSSLVKISHQLWEQLDQVKEELKLQNIMESEQNKILDDSGLPFDMYMPPQKDSIKLEEDTGSPLKLLPTLESCELSHVEWKDHSDIEFEMDVRLVSSSLPPRSPSPSLPSGPLNEVHSSNEDTILMSPVTSQKIQDLDDDDYEDFERAEVKEEPFVCLTSSNFE